MSSTDTKTLDDCINEARIILNDEGFAGQPFRYSNARLLAILNTALREVYRLRPDAYIGNFTTGVLSNNLATTFVEADLGQDPATPYPLDDRLFFSPVVYYLAGQAELADDEFTDSSRAQSLLTAFRQMLTGA